MASRVRDAPLRRRKHGLKAKGKLKKFFNWIISTKVRILIAGGAGFVTAAGTVFGILATVGVFDGHPSSPSVTNNFTNSTVNQYYGTLPTPSGFGPSEPPPNSDCGSQGMGKIGEGNVYISLAGKLSPKDCWSEYLAPVVPGSTARFLVGYRDLSHSIQRNVVVRVILPKGYQLEPNSTEFYDGSNPKGLKVANTDLADGGLIIGSYYPGAGAYITFSLAIPFGNNMACGYNDFRPAATVQPNGMNYFYNTVDLRVANDC